MSHQIKDMVPMSAMKAAYLDTEPEVDWERVIEQETEVSDEELEAMVWKAKVGKFDPQPIASGTKLLFGQTLKKVQK